MRWGRVLAGDRVLIAMVAVALDAFAVPAPKAIQ
jgi:hypothetical protein